MKLLLDEHIDSAFRVQLLRLLPDLEVWRIGEAGAPPLGTLDPDVLIWCEEHGFHLVTNNRKSMPVHLADHLKAGRHIPGILTCSTDQSLASGVGKVTDDINFRVGCR